MISPTREVAVAIIGGGISGLATAIALRQRGFLAHVYEAAPAMAEVGAGIMVPPNAMEVLARLGLADDVRAQGRVLDSAELRDARDGLLQRFDLSAAPGRKAMTTLAIHRARLHDVLLKHLPRETIHVGRRCTGVTEDTGAVLSRFTSGSDVRTDIVIGADGQRSAVRESVRPNVALRHSGQTAFRGIAHATLPDSLSRCGVEYWGPGCRFGFGAISDNEVYWFATMDAPAKERDNGESQRDRCARLFADFPAPVPGLIAATDDEQIIRTDLYDFAPMRPWHRGRVVLVGDAAHATTPNLGQGGAQAIEDAWVLAEQLSRSKDYVEAFAAYEAVRAEKAAFVVNKSRQFGKIVHLSNPIARTARNLLMRATPASVAMKQMRYLFTLNY